MVFNPHIPYLSNCVNGAWLCRTNIEVLIFILYGGILLSNRSGVGTSLHPYVTIPFTWGLLWFISAEEEDIRKQILFFTQFQQFGGKSYYRMCSLRWWQVLHPFTFFPLIVLCAIKKRTGQGPPIGSAYLPLKASLNFMFTSGSPSPAVFLPLVSAHKKGTEVVKKCNRQLLDGHTPLHGNQVFLLYVLYL